MKTSLEIVGVNILDDLLLDKLEKLASNIWTEHYSPIIGIEQVNYMLEKFQSKEAMSQQMRDGYEYFVVLEDNIPVGYFSIIPREETLFLSKAYLAKSQRGKGIFSLMMKKIMEIAKTYEKSSIELTVNKENTNSIQVYKHKGFEIVESAVFDIGEGYVMDDFVLRKQI